MKPPTRKELGEAFPFPTFEEKKAIVRITGNTSRGMSYAGLAWAAELNKRSRK